MHFFCSNTFAQKICASRLFCQMDKFSGIPPNIGFDWVLSIILFGFVWVFVDKLLIKFGFHMGTLLYGIVANSLINMSIR